MLARMGILSAMLWLGLPMLHAQDSTRPSLTGAAAAAARRPAESPGSFNARVGPAYFDLSGGFGIDYNDNVYLSDQQRESDWVFRPNLNLRAFWQVTRLNALNVDIGLGLAKYLDHHDLDSNSLTVSPNSQLSFDVYVGNLRINFHDRFSITENPVDEALLSGVGKFDRFQNSAGASFLWDLNDLTLFADYDHYNFWSLKDEFKTLDHSEEQFSASAALKVDDAVTTGLDVSASMFDYEKNYQNDGWGASVGPFVELQVSRHLKFRASAGYQTMSFDSNGSNADASDLNGWFAYINLSHQLNSHITHSLALGHEARLGLVTNFAEVDYVRYLVNWRINTALTAEMDALYEDSRESDGFQPEDSQRVSLGIALDYAMSRKLTIGLRYRFSLKDSNLALRDYYQNVVSADVRYDF
jgi:hypothetical protein